MRDRRNQRCLRRGEGIGASTRRADEAEGVVEDGQDRRDHQGAEDHADDQRDLLLPRRCADQLAGLEILEIVVRNSCNAENDGGDEQRISDQALRRIDPEFAAENGDQHQRNAEHGEDPDPRYRAIRRADQARHIAGDRGDDRAGDEDVEQAEADGQRGSGGDWTRLGEGGEQEADRDHRPDDGHGDDSDRDVALGQRQAVLPAETARAAGGERRGDALDDRADDLEQGPDRGDADRPGADEADFCAERG